MINFLPGAVIVGDPGESVDVAALEPGAHVGQAMRCTNVSRRRVLSFGVPDL